MTREGCDRVVFVRRGDGDNVETAGGDLIRYAREVFRGPLLRVEGSGRMKERVRLRGVETCGAQTARDRGRGFTRHDKMRGRAICDGHARPTEERELLFG